MSNLAFICIVLLFLAFYTQGQPSERFKRLNGNLEQVITKSPVKPMKFIEPSKVADSLSESIYLSIYSDSIDAKIKYGIYAYYPKHINVNGAEIKIGFPDGTIDVLKQSVKSQENNYSEFALSETMIDKLKNNKYDYLLFVDIAQCADIKDKDYFMRFLNE